MKYYLMIVALFTFSVQGHAESLFESDETLVVELGGPLNSVIKKKDVEQEYPFVLKVNGEELPVRLSARGNSRKGLCVFPPILIQFGNDIPEQSVFSGQDDLKLVTHCYASEKAQADTLKEFAAYRFFSLMTEAAYRVRLLQIDYRDTEGKRDARRYGFLIESTSELAKRLDGNRVRPAAISRRALNDEQEGLVYVFQYLIGNTDWSMVSPDDSDECCHNGKLIEKNQQLLYIPYDFDLSGLVNANYAHPDPSFNIKRVTQRLYRGFCLNPEVLSVALTTAKSHRDGFAKIIGGLPAMSEGKRKKALRFLDRFFDEANDEDQLLKSFEKRCLD